MTPLMDPRRHNFLDQIFVFHPLPWVDRDWRRASGLPLQDVWFTARDGAKLFGWFVEPEHPIATMLWCHGNAGNIIHRLENLAELYRLGLSVFLFDYRGYGRSEGRPSEAGFYQDAEAAYHYIRQQRRIPPNRLVVFGRSLGSAVAADVVSHHPAAGLIMESPFPSVATVARLTYFGAAAHWLLGARFDLTTRLSAISMPILVIHGDRDSIIPLALGKAVFDAASEPKEFHVVRGADHNDLYMVGGRPYFQRLKQFAQKVVR